MRRSLVMVISVALMLGACGGDDSDPAAVLAGFEDARNSGDVDAVMAFYAEDAVVENHALDNDGLATGKLEIFPLEARVPRIIGSTGGFEATDTEVSGNKVTFSSIFHNAQGECFSNRGHQITVKDDKITLHVWSDGEDPSLCE